jgi:hypothetical protein
VPPLFTGSLPPGVVLAITLSALVWWRYRGEDLQRAKGGEIVKMFVIALPALALPFVIRAAVVEDIATAAEVSTIGIVYAFVVGLPPPFGVGYYAAEGVRPIMGYLLALLVGLIIVAIFPLDFDRISLKTRNGPKR